MNWWIDLKWWIDFWIGDRRWYRRMRGGRWQRWWIADLDEAVWITVPPIMPAHCRPPGTRIGDEPLAEERW